MSIARLKKVTLCGLLAEKKRVLDRLQELGCMHLLPLRPAPDEIEKVATPRAEEAYKALRFLTDVPEKRRQVRREAGFDVGGIIDRATALKDKLREITDRRDFLADRIASVTPWGDLMFPPHEALAGYRLWFYILPVSDRRALNNVKLPWQIVRQDNRLIYVVLIAEEEPPSDILPVPRTHTGALPLAELRARLEDTEVEIEDLVAQRQALTRYIYLLSANLAEAENRASLAYADQQTRDDDGIVAVQGWVPFDELPAIEQYAEASGLAWIAENPGPGDAPPTLLEESPEMAAGGDLAMFYQVPSYGAWDPSVMLFFSFSVFFAMILSDAGYGIVLLTGLLAFRKKIAATEKGRGYMLMGYSLFGMALVYGIAVGSYFGVEPPEGSLLGALKIIDINNYPAMMKISITIGILHLMMANAFIAYVKRPRPSALANIGWILNLLAGLLFVFGGSGTMASAVAPWLIGAGLAFVFLFSSERSLELTPKGLALRLLDGFKGLTGVMGMFGDVLSYMRLFALGLASASLALTFNGLAQQVEESVPGLGLLLAIIILLLGHVMNLGLAIMSGVVHGLRLNFIEFYKWGMPEEGTPFRKYARKEAQP